MYKYLLLITFFLISITWYSCDLEKEIDIELPPYDSELVVECYLEAGKPYRLLLSESQAYFDNSTDNPLINNATVTISHNGQTETLDYALQFSSDFKKLYNFSSSTLVPNNLNQDFILSIIDDRGRQISGTTQIIPEVPIDSLVIRKNELDSALILTYFVDPPEANWYRRQLHSGVSIDEGTLDQDFFTDDNLEAEDNQFVFGTAFDYSVGDTIYSTLFHIQEDYYDFLISINDAISSNGNPFVSPSQIKSNVEGGIGIFTGLSYDRDTIIIE